MRLHDQHHVHRAAAEAAVDLGERQAEQAHLGEQDEPNQ